MLSSYCRVDSFIRYQSIPKQAAIHDKQEKTTPTSVASTNSSLGPVGNDMFAEIAIRVQ